MEVIFFEVILDLVDLIIQSPNAYYFRLVRLGKGYKFSPPPQGYYSARIRPAWLKQLLKTTLFYE